MRRGRCRRSIRTCAPSDSGSMSFAASLPGHSEVHSHWVVICWSTPPATTFNVLLFNPAACHPEFNPFVRLGDIFQDPAVPSQCDVFDPHPDSQAQTLRRGMPFALCDPIPYVGCRRGDIQRNLGRPRRRIPEKARLLQDTIHLQTGDE